MTEKQKQDINFNAIFQKLLQKYQDIACVQTEQGNVFEIPFQNTMHGIYCMQAEDDIIVGLCDSAHHQHIYLNYNMREEDIVTHACEEIDKILSDNWVQLIFYNAKGKAVKNDLYPLCEVDAAIAHAIKRRIFIRTLIQKVQVVSYSGAQDRIVAAP